MENKGVKFDWNIKLEGSFHRLKEMVTSAHALKIADLEGNFVVCMDACKQGVGGVLMKDGHVTSYESRKLRNTSITMSPMT